jgi:hypothetical protein
VQDRCTVCAERTIGFKIILDTSNVTPRCMGQVEARFGPFGGSVNLGARYVHNLRRMYHEHGNHFGRT